MEKKTERKKDEEMKAKIHETIQKASEEFAGGKSREELLNGNLKIKMLVTGMEQLDFQTKDWDDGLFRAWFIMMELSEGSDNFLHGLHQAISLWLPFELIHRNYDLVKIKR